MSGATLLGGGASPGLAVGAAWRLDGGGDGSSQRTQPWPAELARARAALAAAHDDLAEAAGRLRAQDRGADAAMVEAGALMALDPALDAAVEDAVRRRARTAAAAIVEAADLHAARIAALRDARLAERASDVRSLGRRAARLAAGAHPADRARPRHPAILVARDLGPADVAELDAGVAGIVLAEGGATAHAAIVARSLGVPMAVGLGDRLLDVGDGTEILVDGTEGEAVVRPAGSGVARARAAMAQRAAAARDTRAGSALAATTRDGRTLRVLVNVAGVAEVRAGLAAGAEGIGLLRTELAFLDAEDWPSESEHRAALTPVLAALGPGRRATIRLLDFGGDKTPHFLRGTPARGIALLLGAPDALAAQLRAIAALPDPARVQVLLPMAQTPEHVDAVRDALRAATGDGPAPPLAAMVETPAAVARAAELAARCALISIGTNDLAHAALGTDRFAPGEGPAWHPTVLRLIAETVAVAHAAGVPVEVCGEAASDPVALPLLVGLGVDELSAGAARVGTVRRWVRALDAGHAQDVAHAALALDGHEAVADLVAGEAMLSVAEAGDAADEPVDRPRRLRALGTQA